MEKDVLEPESTPCKDAVPVRGVWVAPVLTKLSVSLTATGDFTGGDGGGPNSSAS